jgi:hypothetical protein
MASAVLFLGCSILFAPPHVLLGDGAPAAASLYDAPTSSCMTADAEQMIITTLFGMPMPPKEQRILHTDTGKPSKKKRGSASASDQGAIQRGKPISHEVKAEELYMAYQDIREEYKQRATSEEYADKWDILRASANGDTVISMLQHPDDASCPYVRMQAILPGDRQDVWSFLELDNWSETMPKMDPFYKDLQILRRYKYKPSPTSRAVAMVLAKKRTKRIVVYGKRDFTFVSVSDIPRSDDGAWASGTISVITPHLPRDPSYVRGFQDSIAMYEVLPKDHETGEPRSLLTIVCRIDLNDSADGGVGGAVPMSFYTSTIGMSGLISMTSMRSELRKRLDVKLQEEKEEEEEAVAVAVRDQTRAVDETACPLIPWVHVGITLGGTR